MSPNQCSTNCFFHKWVFWSLIFKWQKILLLYRKMKKNLIYHILYLYLLFYVNFFLILGNEYFLEVDRNPIPNVFTVNDIIHQSIFGLLSLKKKRKYCCSVFSLGGKTRPKNQLHQAKKTQEKWNIIKHTLS